MRSHRDDDHVRAHLAVENYHHEYNEEEASSESRKSSTQKTVNIQQAFSKFPIAIDNEHPGSDPPPIQRKDYPSQQPTRKGKGQEEAYPKEQEPEGAPTKEQVMEMLRNATKTSREKHAMPLQ